MLSAMVSRSQRGIRRGSLIGVSLIEVLISIVIASIGLLALAGVNTSSIRYTKMAQYRGTATQLASDIAERMRSNKAGLANYSLQTTFAAQSALPAGAASCETYWNICAPAGVAAYDLQNWQTIVRDQLPEGSAIITVQGVQSAVDLWIVWRDPAVANNDDQPAGVSECPAVLSAGADLSIRCSYFRVNL